MKSYTVGNNSTYENKSGIVPHYEGFFKEKILRCGELQQILFWNSPQCRIENSPQCKFFYNPKRKKSSPLSRIFKRINLTLWGRNLANDILHCEEEKSLEKSPQCRIFHLMTPTLWGSMMITLKFGHFPTMKDSLENESYIVRKKFS